MDNRCFWHNICMGTNVQKAAYRCGRTHLSFVDIFGHLNSEIEYIYMYIIDWTYIPVKPECTELNINMDLKKVLILTREAHGTANTRMVRSNRITNRP